MTPSERAKAAWEVRRQRDRDLDSLRVMLVLAELDDEYQVGYVSLRADAVRRAQRWFGHGGPFRLYRRTGYAIWAYPNFSMLRDVVHRLVEGEKLDERSYRMY